MDFTSLAPSYFVAVVVLACLIVGYIIKHASLFHWIPNDDIPVILAIVGAIMNAIVSKPSVDSIVYGAFMGLSSTGLHQAFKKFVEGKTASDTTKEDD